TENNGHPGDAWGWAASGGLRVNTPMMAPGDYFTGQFVYSQGAVRYTAWKDPGTAAINHWSGNTVGYGFWGDAVYGVSNIELTTAWSATAAYEHYWSPTLRTSLYGSYTNVSHSALATSWICGSQTGVDSAFQSATSCNPDWSSWAVGSRTQVNL